MTGRDLIIYILENGLEDEPVWNNGALLGYMSDLAAAIKFSVSMATIKAWVTLGHLEGIYIGGKLYIPANAKNPLEGGADA